MLGALNTEAGKNQKREAYLEITEKPFIAIVVGVFGVVLVHSTSAS